MFSAYINKPNLKDVLKTKRNVIKEQIKHIKQIKLNIC
jgi:hypothetical protein